MEIRNRDIPGIGYSAAGAAETRAPQGSTSGTQAGTPSARGNAPPIDDSNKPRRLASQQRTTAAPSQISSLTNFLRGAAESLLHGLGLNVGASSEVDSASPEPTSTDPRMSTPVVVRGGSTDNMDRLVGRSFENLRQLTQAVLDNKAEPDCASTQLMHAGLPKTAPNNYNGCRTILSNFGVTFDPKTAPGT